MSDIHGNLEVLGNHDEAVLDGLCKNLAFVARDAIYWMRQQLPPWMREIILHCLEIDASKAYASAAQPAFDLMHSEQVPFSASYHMLPRHSVFIMVLSSWPVMQLFGIPLAV